MFHKRTSRSVCVTLRSDQSGFLETFSATNSNCKCSVIKIFHWNLCENVRGTITVPLRQRLRRRSHVHRPKHQRAQIHVDDQRVDGEKPETLSEFEKQKTDIEVGEMVEKLKCR